MRMSRRGFVKLGSAVASVAVAPTAGATKRTPAGQPAGAAVLPFERKPVGMLSRISDNVPVAFAYPDVDSPCAMIKMGRSTPGGVGSDGDLVAFSTMCPHLGCPVVYNTKSRTFNCPCHYTMFDAEISGQMISGHATANLPQIMLEFDADSGMVFAVGINGKLYGRQANE